MAGFVLVDAYRRGRGGCELARVHVGLELAELKSRGDPFPQTVLLFPFLMSKLLAALSRTPKSTTVKFSPMDEESIPLAI